ncbi:flagellar motor switch protein FliN [Curtobacterium ammoniigenes]|uniref:flagellar motor switch protein FliN n=1 Tax=Curtobacterium ammoniigenes TaxID=395387 RepID=UPI00082DCDFA|nr:flagellar motor switch protein FliN [Curtobacterium ammoniigenes]
MIENAYTAAAQTLATAPLGVGTLHVTPRPAGSPVPAAVRQAVVAMFVGSPSAELALAVQDAGAVFAQTGGALGLDIAAVLHPSLVAASELLGSGVLGDSSVEDASRVFEDLEAQTFTISDESGQELGWFAIRRLATTTSGAGPVDVAGRLARISNIEMALTVEIGRTRMSVRDVLAIEPGGVIELDRSAGAPADVLLNGRLIAHGEIVVVDQDYAVRITQILDRADELV